MVLQGGLFLMSDSPLYSNPPTSYPQPVSLQAESAAAEAARLTSSVEAAEENFAVEGARADAAGLHPEPRNWRAPWTWQARSKPQSRIPHTRVSLAPWDADIAADRARRPSTVAALTSSVEAAEGNAAGEGERADAAGLNPEGLAVYLVPPI